MAERLDGVVTELAEVNAEIKVRRFHELHTANIDKEFNTLKIERLSLRKLDLEAALKEQIEARFISIFNIKKQSLREVFMFSDSHAFTCVVNEELDICRHRGIKEKLIVIVNSLSNEAALDFQQTETSINDSGSVQINERYVLSYGSSYEVSFSDTGAVKYITKIQGDISRFPTHSKLQELSESVLDEVKSLAQKDLSELTEAYYAKLINDVTLSQKIERKKRFIGSF